MLVRQYYYEPRVVTQSRQEGVLYSTVLFGPFESIAHAAKWQDLFLRECQEVFGGKVIEIRPIPRPQRPRKVFSFAAPNFDPFWSRPRAPSFKKRLQAGPLIIKSQKPFQASEDDFFYDYDIRQPVYPNEKELRTFVQKLPQYMLDKRDEAFSEASRRFLMAHEQQRLYH